VQEFVTTQANLSSGEARGDRVEATRGLGQARGSPEPPVAVIQA
jgi:hypothetical protein